MFHFAAMVKNNLFIYNIVIPIRYAFLSSMFVYNIGLKWVKRAIYLTILCFIPFSIWDILYINPDIMNLHDHQMVLYSATIESCLMLFWILLYFYDAVRALKIPNILASPFFWVCSGLLLYYSSLVFITPVLHYTEKWNRVIDIGFMNNIPYIFEILCTIFITIGILNFTKRVYAGR
jgi:hypothetical protein